MKRRGKEEKGKEGRKDGEAISGSLELGTEARKAIRVEVANPQTSKSWKQPPFMRKYRLVAFLLQCA